MRRGRGFTLIELLVVIAIIALLMGVLMPALSRVRNQAKTAGCLMHLKQWGTMFTMYANDYDGRFPTWVYDRVLAQDPVTGVIGMQQQNWTNYMKPYYMGEPKIRFCPAAKRPKNPSGIGTMDTQFEPKPGSDGMEKHQMLAWGIIGVTPIYSLRKGDGGSYGINGWCAWDSTGRPWGAGPKDNTWLWSSMSMKGADRVPMFMDTTWQAVWVVNNTTPADTDALKQGWKKVSLGLRHGSKAKGGVCMVFADTSARKVETGQMYDRAGERRRPCELYEFKWHRKFHNGDVCP